MEKFDDPCLKMYLKEINDISLLSPEEEKTLGEKSLKGDLEARNKMVESNLRLVIKIAKHYQCSGIPLKDLIQEGNIGLIRAAEAFDPSLGFRFSTFAFHKIRQTIMRFVENFANPIRIPVHTIEIINRIRTADRELTVQLGREPKDEELAEALSLTVSEIKDAKECISEMVSLDTPVGEGEDSTIGSLLPDASSSNPEKIAIKNDSRRGIEDVLETLNPREKEIIYRRFGFYNGVPQTLEEVGRAIGLSGERVRQLENKILRKLRNPVRANRLRENFY